MEVRSTLVYTFLFPLEASKCFGNVIYVILHSTLDIE